MNRGRAIDIRRKMRDAAAKCETPPQNARRRGRAPGRGHAPRFRRQPANPGRFGPADSCRGSPVIVWHGVCYVASGTEGVDEGGHGGCWRGWHRMARVVEAWHRPMNAQWWHARRGHARRARGWGVPPREPVVLRFPFRHVDPVSLFRLQSSSGHETPMTVVIFHS